MATRHIVAWALLASLLFGAPYCRAQTAEQVFAAGERAFANGDYSHALAQFAAARDAGLDGPAVSYNIGVCQYRLGDFGAAETTFDDLRRRYPSFRDVADYNLGLALVAQDRPAEARRAFERAVAADDGAVAALAAAMLRRLEPTARPAGRWAGLVDLSIGHDDNVVLLEEASLPAGESSGSAFAELFAQYGGRFAGLPRTRFDASLYSIRYPDVGRFDQDMLRFGARWPTQWTSWRIEPGSYYAYTLLDGDGFERRIAAEVDLRRWLTAQTLFSIRLGHVDIGEVDSRFDFVDGAQRQLRLMLDRRLGARRLRLSYRHERNDRDTAAASPTRDRFALAYRQPVGARWELDIEASYRRSRYDAAAPLREETLLELDVAARRDVDRDWQLAITGRLGDNDADADVFAYDRVRLGVSLSRQF